MKSAPRVILAAATAVGVMPSTATLMKRNDQPQIRARSASRGTRPNVPVPQGYAVGRSRVPLDSAPMSRAAIESKLRDVNVRLRHARAELAVLEEQLLVFLDSAEETRVQALVDESPLSAAEHTEAQRHAEANVRSRDRLAAQVRDLESSRDDLLDRLSATAAEAGPH